MNQTAPQAPFPVDSVRSPSISVGVDASSGTSPARTARLGVVIPLANEESTVDELLEGVLHQLASEDCIFCIIDKASQDATPDGLRAWSSRDPRVRVIWAPENRCVVDAYFRGYREALAADCDWILEMDAGLSHDPAEIPLFLSAMKTGASFAAGSRFMPGGNHEGNSWRWLVSKGGTWLANLLLRTRRRDMASGFECFTRRALGQVVARGVRSRAHFFQTEIRMMLHDLSWVEVPIRYRSPSQSVTGGSVLDALGVLWWLRKQPRLPVEVAKNE